MKTSEMTGPALDWAVAKCEFPEPDYAPEDWLTFVTPGCSDDGFVFQPSTDWSQGGPIIERECISLCPDEFLTGDTRWCAVMTCEAIGFEAFGPTPLVAAMRCLVASCLGDEAEIPQELTIE
jgi:hypothetical protein